MDLGISDRVAFVCGGSKGLGRATSERLAAEGVKVALAARDQSAIDETVAAIRQNGGTALGIQADLSDLAQLENAVARARTELGPVDIAVFNGFTPKHGTFEEVSQDDFDHTYHLLVRCFATLVRAVKDDMKERRWGRIVTIGSRSVKQPLRTHEVPYVLANTLRIAGVGLSKTLANELGPYGITVNTIATGRFDTDANVASSQEISGLNDTTSEEYLAQRMAAIPLRRMGRPEEMAALVSLLCSEGGGYITGETILCDGGRTESMF